MPFLVPQPIRSTESLKSGVEQLAHCPLLSLCLVTDGWDPHSHQVILLAIGDDTRQLVVDCRQLNLEPLTPVLTGTTPKITYQGARDVAMLRSLGIRAQQIIDTLLIEQVISNGKANESLSLKSLVNQRLGIENVDDRLLVLGPKSSGFEPDQIRSLQHRLLSLYYIFLEQVPILKRDGLEDTSRLECEALSAFADLMFDGVFVDRVAWTGLVEDAKRERENLRRAADEHLKKFVPADLFGQININYESEVELKEVLTRLTGRPVRDVSKNTLRNFTHPIGPTVLRLRELQKIISAYGQSFLEFIHGSTGRIHAEFQQIGAPTGRVACSRPNLQSIPRGSRFRNCFCAPAGKKMITADYSGCELRILAEASGDPAFVRTFQRGGDLHSIVASEIFGTPVDKDRRPELRDRAKAINFGLAYGMGASGLAAVTGLTVEEAEQLLNRYFRAFPEVRAYLDESASISLKRGYAQTLGGRRLYLQSPDGLDDPEIAGMARVAKNMPIQGTNADILKVAMTGIRSRLIREELDACMVNCVHDELLLEASEGDAWDVAEMVREEMVKAGERYVRKVPVVVDVTVGDAWSK